MHPELAEIKRLIKSKQKFVDQLKKDMLRILACEIEDLSGHLPPESDAEMRSDLIEKGKEVGFETPMLIIQTVSTALSSIKDLIHTINFEEKEMEEVIIQNSSVLGRLIAIGDPTNIKESTWFSTPWSKRRPRVTDALKTIKDKLEKVVKNNAFLADHAENVSMELKEAKEGYSRAVERIKTELSSEARVMMSTIASSHQFPVASKNTTKDAINEFDIDDLDFNNLDINDHDIDNKCEDDEIQTIVVFDEAGCIPAFELLGLSRLNRAIKALICVGDKHQLPPYDPNSMGSQQNSRFTKSQDTGQKIHSLLDVSKLEVDGDRGGKILLKKQYRVPKDIANILNVCVYNGDYRTPPNSRVPDRGFHLVHVNGDSTRGYKKYENESEVQKCLELVIIHYPSAKNIMVLTPVRFDCFDMLYL